MTVTVLQEAHQNLQPGDPGLWLVVGVCSGACVRTGDVVVLDGDAFKVNGMFTSKSSPIRVGIIGEDGERFTLGAMCRVRRYRQGTHATLCDRCVR